MISVGQPSALFEVKPKPPAVCEAAGLRGAGCLGSERRKHDATRSVGPRAHVLRAPPKRPTRYASEEGEVAWGSPH